MNYTAFLAGKAADDKGRYIEDILSWGFFRLEFRHDYIQRLFPLPERSQADRRCEPLTDEDVTALRNSEDAVENMRRAYAVMLRFWKLDGDRYRNPAEKRHWVRKSGKDHNLLRMSRVLKCLKLVDPPSYEDFAVRISCLLDLAENGMFPLRAETRRIWRKILSEGGAE